MILGNAHKSVCTVATVSAGIFYIGPSTNRVLNNTRLATSEGMIFHSVCVIRCMCTVYRCRSLSWWLRRRWFPAVDGAATRGQPGWRQWLWIFYVTGIAQVTLTLFQKRCLCGIKQRRKLNLKTSTEIIITTEPIARLVHWHFARTYFNTSTES